LDLVKEFFNGVKGEASRGQRERKGEPSRSRTGRRSSPPPPARTPAAGKKPAAAAVFPGYGAEMVEGKEWRGLPRFVAGRRLSPPPAGLPAAEQEMAATAGVLRSPGEEEMNGLGFSRAFLGLYTPPIPVDGFLSVDLK
jgi:hypothetical protein